MTSPTGHWRRRAVFIDVDGTYAHQGRVPAGHADAVSRVRAAGHLVFLCTGRPMSLLPPHVTAAGFDGVVAGAGAYVSWGDEVLLDTRFPAELAARAITVLDAHGALFFLEAPEATHARRAVIEAMRHFGSAQARADVDPDADAGGEDLGRDDVTNALRATEDLGGIAFGKITSLYARTPLGEIAAEIGPEVSVLTSSMAELGPGAGEIFLAQTHKAVGIEAMLARLGMAREDVVAAGDGPNDLEMLAFAGTAVVIEGSSPELLAHADVVAAPPEREGLVAAFATLGLLAR
ncbi:HAD hydrolase family protein [Demequina sp.]|uniref:HAD hydrolase family protein n=1 Tax=Demequina sp. TaxID=2050685 RepID=UPI0025D60EFC|nr:HAD family hydrolase [Demequina sp.]